MVTVVNFNKRIPPRAAGAGRGTLAELMAKSKAAADAQTKAVGAESPTIMQGIGNLAQVISGGIREGRAERQLDTANKEVGSLMGKVDPAQGASMDIISQAQQYDPELAKSLLADRVQRQRSLADADQWLPATPEEKAALGAAPGDPIMRNKHNGEFKSLAAGGNTTISTGDKVETEWGKDLAKRLSERVNTDITAGQEATVKMAQMNSLSQLMKNGYTGNEAMVSEWIRKNVGISLGPQADATAAFSAIIDHMVPKQREAGSGTTSNFDAQMFKNSLPDLLKSPNANNLIMGYINGMAQHDQAVAQIAQQAAMMPDPAAAQKFYYDAVNKLPKPLGNLQQVVDDIRKQDPNNPDNAVPPPRVVDPNNPDQPADPAAVGAEVIVNPQPDPKKPSGGIKSSKKNADGTTTYTFHDGTTATMGAQ
jgi:hypothetical protein